MVPFQGTSGEWKTAPPATVLDDLDVRRLWTGPLQSSVEHSREKYAMGKRALEGRFGPNIGPFFTNRRMDTWPPTATARAGPSPAVVQRSRSSTTTVSTVTTTSSSNLARKEKEDADVAALAAALKRTKCGGQLCYLNPIACFGRGRRQCGEP